MVLNAKIKVEGLPLLLTDIVWVGEVEDVLAELCGPEEGTVVPGPLDQLAAQVPPLG